MIALGVVAAVWLFGRRLEERASAPARTPPRSAMWAVARRRHRRPALPRDHRLGALRGRLGDIVKIWEGGLGIPGGMLAGVLVGDLGGPPPRAPAGRGRQRRGAGPALAQAIGRWGNWFNQELFGRPDRPAVGAGDRRRAPPAGYQPGTTFHPTFLYESLWNSGSAALLLWIDRRSPAAAAGDVRVGYG